MIELALLWVKDHWKFVVGLTTIVVAFGFGYFKGYSHEHNKFQEHLNSDATAMAVAKAENERRVAQQVEITNRIAKEYASAVDKLNEYYESHPRIVRLCDRPSDTNTMPSTSKSASGTNKAISRAPETSTIEIDLLIAGREVEQCRALIQWELEQDRVQ